MAKAKVAGKQHVRLSRGCIQRAYLPEDDPIPIGRLTGEHKRSSYGAAFKQHLDCKRLTWAIKGVRGSR